VKTFIADQMEKRTQHAILSVASLNRRSARRSSGRDGPLVPRGSGCSAAAECGPRGALNGRS